MLKNSKTSFKIGGSVGIIILLLGITVMFGMYQMSKVSNEIIEISQEYAPLNEIVSDIKFQKSTQTVSLEKIIRYTDSDNLLEIEKAKEEFWLSGGIIGSDIERGKNIINVGMHLANSEKSVEEFRTLFQKLSNIKTTHEQYEILIGDLFLELNYLKLNDDLLKQILNIENQLEMELDGMLVLLSTLVDESTNQIEDNERDSLTGQIIIITIVGTIATALGFFISQINSDLKKEVDLKTKELKTANEKLKELDRMKDEFIGIASHELRSPLQPILGFAELAKSGDIDQKEAWDGVLQLTNKLQDLANAVLDVSKIESGRLELQLEKIKINDLILDITKSQKINLKKPVIIRENLDENIQVEIDKVRIGQVLQNLLNNAMKFTPRGTISIDTHVYQDENKIQVKISDTGLGIPEEILPKIFEKFVTKGIKNVEQSGTGLGLFLCKGIIQAHGGEITAQNKFDVGAIFEFSIPILQKNKIMDPSQLSINKKL
jgi:signal transduction histidine kinase